MPKLDDVLAEVVKKSHVPVHRVHISEDISKFYEASIMGSLTIKDIDMTLTRQQARAMLSWQQSRAVLGPKDLSFDDEPSDTAASVPTSGSSKSWHYCAKIRSI